MQLLNQNINFPDVCEATEDGLLAIGGDLSVQRLIYAYKHGIFPWFNAGEPILWWSPNPRFVLFPEKLKISKSMKQVLRNKDYAVTINKDFKAVITACSKAKRDGQKGTWITNEMIEAYIELHSLGFAKSVEKYKTEYYENSFDYVNDNGNIINNGVYLMYYDTDLTIKQEK